MRKTKEWQNVFKQFRRYGLKESSAQSYERGLRRFCKYVEKETGNPLKPNDFPTLGLEKIEDLMTDFIADNRDVLAPKYLNVIFNSVKRWCYIIKMIKSTKMFKEIKFDKSSRSSSALKEQMLETKDVKTSFRISNLDDQIDLGLYALVGLRPQLIPQLKVKDIYPRNYEIDKDGKFRFTAKPPMMIIPRQYKGNKANIDFMVFVPTKIAELIEIRLNRNGKVTEDSKLSETDNAREMYYKMKRILSDPAINFNGRPYLLRSVADRILRRLVEIKNQKNLKEFLMGHKGDISAIYQMRGMPEEEEQKYRSWYVECCDKYINEQIFEIISREDRTKGSIILEMAKKLGASKEEIMDAFKDFETGKMTFNQFNDKMTDLIKQAQDKLME